MYQAGHLHNPNPSSSTEEPLLVLTLDFHLIKRGLLCRDLTIDSPNTWAHDLPQRQLRAHKILSPGCHSQFRASKICRLLLMDDLNGMQGRVCLAPTALPAVSLPRCDSVSIPQRCVLLCCTGRGCIMQAHFARSLFPVLRHTLRGTLISTTQVRMHNLVFPSIKSIAHRYPITSTTRDFLVR